MAAAAALVRGARRRAAVGSTGLDADALPAGALAAARAARRGAVDGRMARGARARRRRGVPAWRPRRRDELRRRAVRAARVLGHVGPAERRRGRHTPRGLEHRVARDRRAPGAAVTIRRRSPCPAGYARSVPATTARRTEATRADRR